MQAQQAGIDLREEIFAQEEKKSERQQAKSQKTNYKGSAVFQGDFQ